MQILDAHCHFWQLARGDYDWLAGAGAGAGDGDVAGDGGGDALRPLRRDFGPQDHPGHGRVIAVQAAATLAETDYLLALPDARIAGVVGWVDLTDPGAVTALRSRAANPRFKGIRPMLQDIADTDWLSRAPRPDALAELARLGLRFDALVTERHLPVLARFAGQHPDLPIVIDHAAKPQPGARPAWQAGMQALARDPRIHCKLSGLMTELSAPQRQAPLDPLRRILDPLLAWFGPDRLIWGSDWPVLTLAASYQQWLDLTQELLRDLTSAQQAAIMAGNAARFYGVEP